MVKFKSWVLNCVRACRELLGRRWIFEIGIIFATIFFLPSFIRRFAYFFLVVQAFIYAVIPRSLLLNRTKGAGLWFVGCLAFSTLLRFSLKYCEVSTWLSEVISTVVLFASYSLVAVYIWRRNTERTMFSDRCHHQRANG